jgi:DNA-directed RNA polymerase subunit RPC12/RpoP
VAWCEECSRRIDDNELGDDGECPDCGSVTLARRPIPWHFKLLIVATVIYLGYRTFQGVTWVLHHV